AQIADKYTYVNAYFFQAVFIARTLRLHRFEETVLVSVQHRAAAHERRGNNMNVEIRIVRYKNFHITDERRYVDSRFPHRNVSLGQIDDRIANEVADVHRLQIPAFMPHVDVAKKPVAVMLPLVGVERHSRGMMIMLRLIAIPLPLLLLLLLPFFL